MVTSDLSILSSYYFNNITYEGNISSNGCRNSLCIPFSRPICIYAVALSAISLSRPLCPTKFKQKTVVPHV